MYYAIRSLEQRLLRIDHTIIITHCYISLSGAKIEDSTINETSPHADLGINVALGKSGEVNLRFEF